MASTNRDEISRLELLHAAHPDGLVFPHLADAYRRAGRYAQAESVLNAGLRRHADYSSAHVVLGRLRLDQGKHREAEAAFRRVLQLDPQNHVAIELLGRLAEEQGRLEEALAHFRRLATLKPADELAEHISELQYRILGVRDARADRGAGPAPREHREPDSRPVSHGNGGGHTESTAAPAPAPALPEPGEVVTETMAELYSRQGLYERAEAVYRQLAERDPGNARLRSKLNDSIARRSAGRADVVQDDEPDVASAPSIRGYLSDVLAWRPADDAQPRTDPADEAGSEASAEPEPEGLEREPKVVEPEIADLESAASKARGEMEPWAMAPVSEPPPMPDSVAAPPPERMAQDVDTAAARPGPTPAELGLVEDDLEGAGAATRVLIALTDMLVGLLEYRDPFFRGSSSLTRLLATNVAEEMGLAPADRVNLALAAVLRDLGRLALGGRLVEIQNGKGTPEARRKIERHVDLALDLLDGIELPRPVMLAVRHHHERWDGAGYPDGLMGDEIPLLARVLAAVDSFAAMVSPRPYRLPRKVPDAARELKLEAGEQYDPQVVNALLRVLERRDQPSLGFVRRNHLLLVNPDQPEAVVTAARLCTSGYLAEVAVDTDAARERLRRVPVAAVVVSAEAGAEEVEALIRDLRLDPLFASLPIVAVDVSTVALRVGLLEGGADVCFPPGISYGELHGTLGALVRRTLRSGEARPEAGDDESPWLALQGDIQDFPLAWLLQVMKYDSRTAAIGIRTTSDQGAIYIERGDAVHAQIRGGQKGEGALKAMLQWRKGRFTVQPDARPKERTIESSIMHLLLTQAVEEDHAAAGVFGAVDDQG